MTLLSAPRVFVRLAPIVLLLSAPALTAAEPARATDWPEWHGPHRDLISTETDWSIDWPASGPKVLWKAEVGIGFSTVSVAAGRVYTMGNQNDEDIVWCFDASSGKVIWTHRYPSKKGNYPGPRMTPTVDGNRVYTLSRWGRLFCLGAADGKVIWQLDTTEHGVKQSKYKWGLACSPLVIGDRLYLDLGVALCLEKTTGKLVWASGNDQAGFSSPTTIEIGGKTYLNCFTHEGLVLVDTATGKELDRFAWETSWRVNAASPIPSGDKVFISSGYGKGCALFKVSPSGLDLVYKNREMRNHCNSCVLWKGHIYGFDGQQGSTGRLKCIEYATGKVVWATDRRQTPLKVGGSLMLAGGKLISMLDGGTLMVAEATTEGFKELARAKVLDGQCWTHPVLSGGRIYCRSNKQGQLVCLDVSK